MAALRKSLFQYINVSEVPIWEGTEMNAAEPNAAERLELQRCSPAERIACLGHSLEWAAGLASFL